MAFPLQQTALCADGLVPDSVYAGGAAHRFKGPLRRLFPRRPWTAAASPKGRGFFCVADAITAQPHDGLCRRPAHSPQGGIFRRPAAAR